MRHSFVALTLAGALLTPLAASAQAMPSDPPTVKDAETAMLTYVAADSVAEIALSKLALMRSKNPSVRTFAQSMIDAHTTILNDVVALGKTDGETIPQMPSEEGVISYVHLTKYDGKLFDENFMDAQVMDHESDIDALRHAYEISTTPAIVAMEKSLLAKYESHLDAAMHALDVEARQE